MPAELTETISELRALLARLDLPLRAVWHCQRWKVFGAPRAAGSSGIEMATCGTSPGTAKELAAAINALPALLDAAEERKEIRMSDQPTYHHAGLEWSPTAPERMPHAEALAYVERLNRERYAGHDDWRLPTVQELVAAVDYTRHGPATTLPATQSSFYWSSTTYQTLPDFAWGVNFYVGSLGFDYKSFDFYVRAVRGGSCSDHSVIRPLDDLAILRAILTAPELSAEEAVRRARLWMEGR